MLIPINVRCKCANTSLYKKANTNIWANTQRYIIRDRNKIYAAVNAFISLQFYKQRNNVVKRPIHNR